MTPASRKKKRVIFLINPGAGQRAAAKVAKLAPGRFHARQWNLQFVELNDWRETFPLALKAARQGAWAVVAVGGDGTINQVAQALAGTACRLGIIPAGTGNGFARALGIPLDADGACRVLAAGKSRRVDHASVDRGRGYANMLGIGWDAWIAEKANKLRWLNRISGFLRYLAAAALCVHRLRPQHLLIQMGSKKISGRFMVVAVGNSPQYGFGCTVAPMAKLDDGKLDVVLMPMTGPITFLRNSFRLFKQKPLLGATFHRAASLSIHSLEGRELPIHLDGEPGGTTPAVVRLNKRVLNVVVP